MSGWTGWRKQLLAAGGWPESPGNLTFLSQWHTSEGGNATNNPLNTTQKWPGSTDYNAAGVQNYPTHKAGIDATLKTLHNGLYKFILEALASGDPYTFKNADGVALDLNTWGSHAFAQEYLAEATHVKPGVGSHPNAGVQAASAWQRLMHTLAFYVPAQWARERAAITRIRKAVR